MFEDGSDYLDDPGIIALLTDEGAGCLEGAGFHAALEQLHGRGWRVEISSWTNCCNSRMKRWAGPNGVFMPLDDFYDSITFREPSREGHEFAPPRDSASLDLSQRQTAQCGIPGCLGIRLQAHVRGQHLRSSSACALHLATGTRSTGAMRVGDGSHDMARLPPRHRAREPVVGLYGPSIQCRDQSSWPPSCVPSSLSWSPLR